jgi:hypothetical protein
MRITDACGLHRLRQRLAGQIATTLPSSGTM